jgi:chondroitin 4-sulfotransferase 11
MLDALYTRLRHWYSLYWKNNYPNANWREGYIFIHIPKTAGTSVYTQLGLPHSTHCTAQEFIEILGPRQFDRMFKFCFVRNPWARFLSLYNYARMEVSHYHNNLEPDKTPYGPHLDYPLLKDATLNQCAHYLLEGRLQHAASHNLWLPQVAWTNDSQGQSRIDYTGRVERLEEDFAAILQELGHPPKSLPNINRSTRQQGYQDAFDAATRKLVAQYYEADIEQFKYQF